MDKLSPSLLDLLSTSGCQKLLYGVFRLARALRAQDADQKKILDSVRAICGSFPELVKKGAISGTSTGRRHNNTNPPPLEEVCTVFGRIYPLLLSSLQSAVFGEAENQHKSARITEIVRSYQTFLGQLHQSALDEFVRLQDERAKPRTKSSRNTVKAGNRGESMTISVQDKQRKCVVQILTEMVTSLEVIQPQHCEVLEGLMCALLDHIGSSLALLVFAESESTTEDDSGICPPQGLLHVAHLDNESAIGAARIERPYLVYVLRQAIDFLYANAATMPEDSLVQFLPLTWTQSDNQKLREGLEQCLQNTLLRGVFGGDEESFDNDGLRRMDINDSFDTLDITTLAGSHEDSSDTFVSQLWEHLGWNILSGRRTI